MIARPAGQSNGPDSFLNLDMVDTSSSNPPGSCRRRANTHHLSEARRVACRPNLQGAASLPSEAKRDQGAHARGTLETARVVQAAPPVPPWSPTDRPRSLACLGP